MSRVCLASVLFFACAAASTPADEPARRTPREALQEFNDLIGSWRGTGEPEGTRAEKMRGFWTESVRWEWQFKGDDAWLRATFDKGKYFTAGELRYLPREDRFRLKMVTTGKETLDFEGTWSDNQLTVERTDDKAKETQRLVFTLLRTNRYLYRCEVKSGDQTFARRYQVGATKEGVPFAGPGDAIPECVVSGGRGTIRVSYKGKTYYVCCGGCRDAFNDTPEKYIKEYEERKAREKK